MNAFSLKTLESIGSDFRGNLFHYANKIRLFLWMLYSTIIVKLICVLKNINLAHGCIFFGLPIFRRKPYSTIVIGENCRFRSDFTSNLIGINRKCVIATHRKNAQLVIGRNSGFSGTVIGCFEKITIGNNVICGANVLITDSDWHSIDPFSRNNSYPETKPVIINDNVWLGLNVVVLKGVSIGENTVIGANSLVTKNIPANVIAAGNPCKIIRDI